MATDWREAIAEWRRRKDEAFADGPGSPIPPDERERFDGLEYYDVDEDYRFVLELHEHDRNERITVGTSTDGEQEYVRWGEFRVPLGDGEITLQAYKGAPHEDRLWVPFRDATSGGKTYGGGRYIDLEPDEHRTGDGRWVLDFNLAYNPTCAYSDAYECPLPPSENWLDVPIEAGERSFHP